MFWGIPGDVAIFAVAVLAFFVVGLPLITSRVSVPTRFEFEELPENDLTPEQPLYFADLAPKMHELD